MTDTLDRVPQVARDYANHVIYGGMLFMAAVLGAMLFHARFPMVQAAVITFGIAGTKKLHDLFYDNEPLTMVLGKTVVTMVWPLSLWVFAWAAHIGRL